MNNPDQKLIEQLELATKDLLWLSETEYPMQVVYWQDENNFTQETLLQQHNYSPDTKITTKEFAAFFTAATKQETWHNEAEQAQVKKYQALVNLMTENLTNIKVYLLGEIEIVAYILGTTQHKAIAGVTTQIVAT
ncbi:nuclease [Pleurocapsa sp. CCALA 161]|uniref:nuclease A inhibitor family protein n=1 Tax=Pleurocapsa sp. CCALA 161 TaxID=2107688 RepID=UPI000D06F77E|nr:nuclease A inhibitor family protein [Pleurocapsa sp. CCALA 161]PSB11016.1 nuclease [Pleurocapsa sp. CCALA 161]